MSRFILSKHDVLFITLDSLRYDVAVEAMEEGLTPHLENLLSPDGWEERHSPGNFTYSAHQAFFAGFLPTPISPGLHNRLFSARFAGSETTGEETCVFDSPDIISGFRSAGYHTICIGGVGFFNKENPLGCVLPELFEESYWSKDLGVTEKHSTKNQVELAVSLLGEINQSQRIFLFINVSATHQPNCLYVEGASVDSTETQKAALAYVDQQLPALIEAMKKRGSFLAVILSDHGTAYGEGGFYGHRVSHPVVWTVPYAQRIFEANKF
jgi:hypothetical protein